MTNADKVRTYVKYHKEPVQESVPEFFQKWNTQYGPEYWRSSSCQRSQWTPDGAIVKAPGKNYVESTYIHYIPEYDMIEFSKVAIDNNGRHRDYEVHKWEYSWSRFFLVKGDVHPYDSHGEELWPESNGKYYNIDFYRYLKDLKHSFFFNAGNPQYNEFERFCGYRMDPVDFAEEYYRYMAPRNHIDGLPEPKKDRREIVQEYILHMKQTAYPPYRACSSLDPVYFEKIDEENAIIRFFTVINADKGTDLMGLYECCRIYITPKGVKTLQGHLGAWTVGKPYLWGSEVFNRQEFLEFKRISYIYNTALELDDGQEDLETIYKLLRYPVIELLYKSGYKYIAKYIMGRCAISFKNIFGKSITSEGNIYRRTGCNKYMLELINGRNSHRYDEFGEALKIFRKVFGRDFMCFTRDKIEKYFNAFVELGKCAQSRHLRWDRIIPVGEKYSNDDIKILERLVKIYNKEDHSIFSSLADTSSMFEQLGLDYDSVIADTLHSAGDIFALHDRMVIQYNTSRDKLNKIKAMSLQNSFESLLERRAKLYNYENGKYMIRIPESINEIINEGNKLHHCVGSYAHDHAKGITDIVFLREKSKPDEPYYTIEVKNKKVIQIHGFANRWLGCSPEAVSFVYEWTQERQLKCEKYILLSQAQGYVRTGVLLDDCYLYSNSKHDVEDRVSDPL